MFSVSECVINQQFIGGSCTDGSIVLYCRMLQVLLRQSSQKALRSSDARKPDRRWGMCSYEAQLSLNVLRTSLAVVRAQGRYIVGDNDPLFQPSLLDTWTEVLHAMFSLLLLPNKLFAVQWCNRESLQGLFMRGDDQVRLYTSAIASHAAYVCMSKMHASHSCLFVYLAFTSML